FGPHVMSDLILERGSWRPARRHRDARSVSEQLPDRDRAAFFPVIGDGDRAEMRVHRVVETGGAGFEAMHEGGGHDRLAHGLDREDGPGRDWLRPVDVEAPESSRPEHVVAGYDGDGNPDDSVIELLLDGFTDAIGDRNAACSGD